MSAPHITGICALLLQKVRRKRISKIHAADEVKRLLYLNTIDYGSVGKDDIYGNGFVRYQPEVKPSFKSIGRGKYYHIGEKL